MAKPKWDFLAGFGFVFSVAGLGRGEGRSGRLERVLNRLVGVEIDLKINKIRPP